jgi:hypothetical protein
MADLGGSLSPLLARQLLEWRLQLPRCDRRRPRQPRLPGLLPRREPTVLGGTPHLGLQLWWKSTSFAQLAHRRRMELGGV